jgi:lysophospholipase L1-like esterase
MGDWVGTWGASPAAPVHFVPLEIMPAPAPIQGTLRHRLRISAGGLALRLRLSNETGERPLAIGGISIGLAAEAMAVRHGSIRQVTFSGQAEIVIPPGSSMESDPIDLAVAPLGEVVVSIYLPSACVLMPSEGAHKAFLSHRHDSLISEAWSETDTVAVRPIVTGISVNPLSPTRVIVALGDSVTDGGACDASEGRSWTDILARRLHERGGTTPYAVVNAGIGGNRLIGSFIGAPALARLDRDVFGTPGVTHLIVLEGINDIGVGGRTVEGVTHPFVTVEQIIAAYIEIIERCRERNVKVVGGTLLPFRGAFFFSDAKEVVRQSVNAWIRGGGAFDGVIDFEGMVQDPRDPGALRPEFDTGDHLHPNAAAYRAMGHAIDLDVFE